MNPLRAFTARGVGFLCAGPAVIGAGLVIGERDLVGLGVLVLLLPVLSLLTVAGAPRAIAHSRALQPARVAAGSDARVLIRVANSAALLPVGGLLAEDTLPHTLGERPRFTIGYLRPRGVRDLTYRVRTQVRGHYPVGPLRLSFTDPLGCVCLGREVGTPTSLLVTPPIVRLSEVPLPGGAAEGGDSTARTMSAGGQDDPIPRAYRHGDDLRRVHWRSTARHGELMVRREEHQWSDRSVVLLDMRAGAHAGTGADASVETAVSAAASIALHLSGRGQEIRLLTDGAEIASPRGDGFLDALATARPSAGTGLHGAAELLGAAPVTGRGRLVAVLGAVGPADIDALGRARAGREHDCTAILCRTAAWPSPDAARAAGEALSAAGWLVAEVGSARDLAGAWARLADHPIRPGATR
ncbi:DUF58 domain-containing protein [Nocardiopsis sediminis]|uniref:DUF58 domain-containing protein n=1 Tax=Nocardiopsis sediminis TaxID=1778267 RepID=A0ABV8FUX5_9ACTN